MNRKAIWAAAAGLVVATGAAFWLSYRGEAAPPQKAAPPAPSAPPAETSASGSVAPPSVPSRPATGRFEVEEDGSPVPPLPDSAPQRVQLGVALFAYEGAQGVPGALRSREQALELARNAIRGAQGQFSQILSKADPGSREDVGWIRRGVLERRVERAVFLLEKGTTAKEPIDTPRGYWVVQRVQ